MWTIASFPVCFFYFFFDNLTNKQLWLHSCDNMTLLYRHLDDDKGKQSSLFREDGWQDDCVTASEGPEWSRLSGLLSVGFQTLVMVLFKIYMKVLDKVSIAIEWAIISMLILSSYISALLMLPCLGMWKQKGVGWRITSSILTKLSGFEFWNHLDLRICHLWFWMKLNFPRPSAQSGIHSGFMSPTQKSRKQLWLGGPLQSFEW